MLLDPDALADGALQALRVHEPDDAAEGEGLRVRWEFGRDLVGRRVGKQLPKGLLNEIAERTGKSRQELGYRMRFAERYVTEAEVANAIGNFGSWFAIVNDALSPTRELTPGLVNKWHECVRCGRRVDP